MIGKLVNVISIVLGEPFKLVNNDGDIRLVDSHEVRVSQQALDGQVPLLFLLLALVLRLLDFLVNLLDGRVGTGVLNQAAFNFGSCHVLHFRALVHQKIKLMSNSHALVLVIEVSRVGFRDLRLATNRPGLYLSSLMLFGCFFVLFDLFFEVHAFGLLRAALTLSLKVAGDLLLIPLLLFDLDGLLGSVAFI